MRGGPQRGLGAAILLLLLQLDGTGFRLAGGRPALLPAAGQRGTLRHNSERLRLRLLSAFVTWQPEDGRSADLPPAGQKSNVSDGVETAQGAARADGLFV